MWRPKNSFEALLPIQLINWLFNFEIIHYPLNNPKNFLSIAWTISSIITYFISLHYSISYHPQIYIATRANPIVFILFIINNTIYFSNIIHVWIRRNKTRELTLSARNIDETLEKLNLPLDYRSIFIQSMTLIIPWGIVALSNIITSIIHYWNIADGLTLIVAIITFQHTFHANAYFMLNVSMTILLMEYRFKNINKLLFDRLDKKKTGEKLNIDCKFPPVKLFVNIAGDFNVHTFTSQLDTTNDILRIARHLQLESCCLYNEFSLIFGIHVTMILTISFIFVILFIFMFYTTLIESNMNSSSEASEVIILLMQLSSYCFIIYIINVNCAKIINEWKKTGVMIHELEILSKNKEYRDEIRQFSLQILQNPPTFSACGFITLGYTFLQDFVSSVTIYVIILVQVYNSLPKNNRVI